MNTTSDVSVATIIKVQSQWCLEPSAMRMQVALPNLARAAGVFELMARSSARFCIALVNRHEVPRVVYGRWLSAANGGAPLYRSGGTFECSIIAMHERMHRECSYAQARCCVAREMRRAGEYCFLMHEKPDGKEHVSLPEQAAHTLSPLAVTWGLCFARVTRDVTTGLAHASALGSFRQRLACAGPTVCCAWVAVCAS